MSEVNIEKELLKATGFKPKRDYSDRQDYLAALARAADELGKDEFDQLSNEAADWFNAACEALNDQDEIPEFDGTLSDPDEVSDTDADEDEGGSEEDNEAAEAAAHKATAAPPEEDEAVQADDGDPEPEPEEKPAKKVKKQAKAKEPVPAKAPKAPKKPEPVNAPLRSSDQIKLDKFGLAEGTQNHAAISMLQKGCRMADITATIGGTYYNVLRRLVAAGHKLEKRGDGTLLLTHKDDVGKKAKK